MLSQCGRKVCHSKVQVCLWKHCISSTRNGRRIHFPLLNTTYVNRKITFSSPNVNSESRIEPSSSDSDIVRVEVKSKVKKKEKSEENLGTKINTSEKEIYQYLSNKENTKRFIDDLPKQFFKKKRTVPDVLYLVDEDVAKDIVKSIGGRKLKKERVIWLENNPGLCLITEELLQNGLPRLRLLERSKAFLPEVEKLQSKYKGRVEVKNGDVLEMSKLIFQDKLDNKDRVGEFLEGIPPKPWLDDPAVKVISTAPQRIYLQHLVYNFVNQTGLISIGRPELYLIMHPSNYLLISSGPEDGHIQYKPMSVLFQILFETELLLKVPRKAFFPWEVPYTPKKSAKLTKLFSVDPELLYLVKITPRRTFFTTVVPSDQLQLLWFFVKHHFVSRKNPVIPHLERWIPGCGPRLVKRGYSIFTQFGDLTPPQVVELFQQFISWPEFTDCPFRAALEGSLLKSEPADVAVDDGDGDAEEDEHHSHIPPQQ